MLQNQIRCNFILDERPIYFIRVFDRIPIEPHAISNSSTLKTFVISPALWDPEKRWQIPANSVVLS